MATALQVFQAVMTLHYFFSTVRNDAERLRLVSKGIFLEYGSATIRAMIENHVPFADWTTSTLCVRKRKLRHIDDFALLESSGAKFHIITPASQKLRSMSLCANIGFGAIEAS